MECQSWRISDTKRWYNFTTDIRLFHGTSSALIPNILSQGLIPPLKNLHDRVSDAILAYGVIPTEKLMKKCEESWNGEGAVCLASSQINAAMYARHYKNGGELNGLVKDGLQKALRRKIPDLYAADSVPVVLEIIVPIGYLEQYTLDAMRETAIWMQTLEMSKTLRNRDLIIKGTKGGEIRILNKITPVNIKRIMKVPKSYF